MTIKIDLIPEELECDIPTCDQTIHTVFRLSDHIGNPVGIWVHKVTGRTEEREI